jgi:hypothetical protein
LRASKRSRPPAIRLGGVVVDGGVGGEDVDHLQAVTLAHFVVVEIVRRGDLHAAGAEGGVHVIVGNDGNAAAAQGQLHELADQVLITLVIGVHGHGGVAQHGLGARGGMVMKPSPRRVVAPSASG